MNPFLLTDGYKTGHVFQYPHNTTLVYSNFTPRSLKYAPKGCDVIVSFGQQMMMRQIKEMFGKHFFKTEERKTLESYRGTPELPEGNYQVRLQELKDGVIAEIKEEYSLYLGQRYSTRHIEELWDLGYLPIKVKALPEGTLVPAKVPVLTIYNTLPQFFWIPNFLETIISNLLWKPMTSASIAFQYKKNLLKWAKATDENSLGFVDFQGHDFSMRGLDSIDATISSGLGHATSFLGSDSLPVIYGARKYYDTNGFVVGSVNATEHSVMCAGGHETELETFKRLMYTYPSGILSVVSDTWDLWKVITEILPALKYQILARDGKLVIRPDSGNPVDIICGRNYEEIDDVNDLYFADSPEVVYCKKSNKFYETNAYDDGHKMRFNLKELSPSEIKGVIELLWDIFGGTINEQGFKVLDPHIGAIYGDSITIDRAEQICERLAAKGFASTNIVLGVGSFTYQYNTRDTFGFAMKATYVEISHKLENMDTGKVQTLVEQRPIFKDPVTDDGTKKSAKGLLQVYRNKGAHGMSNYILKDECTWEEEAQGDLQTIFEDGVLFNQITLGEVRSKISNILNGYAHG